MNCVQINKMSHRLQFLEGGFVECRKIKNDLQRYSCPGFIADNIVRSYVFIYVYT